VETTKPKKVGKALDFCLGSCIMDFVELIKEVNYEVVKHW
jgi:hypothetical protein